MLRLRGVCKSFGDHSVLSGVDLDVREGESVAILGRSGSGKSCLLRIILGLMEVDSGSVELWGRPMTDAAEEEWIPLRRRMGMVFQSGALFDSMTVFDNVAFPLREQGGFDEDRIAELARERLEWVELPDTAGYLPSELSGGMRRRVALARTLSFEPEFVLFDEPTTGLDPITSRKIATLMRDLDRKLRSTSILVTHDLECARIVSSRWAYLSGGKVLVTGTPDELARCESEEVKEFLGDTIGPKVAPPGSQEQVAP